MDIHYLQHVPFEGLGAIEGLMDNLGVALTPVRLYRGELPPPATRPQAVIVLGGPMGVSDATRYPWLAAEKRFLRSVLDRDTPVLGICLGAQLIADALGAAVYRNAQPEIGWFSIQRRPEARRSRLGRVLPERLTVFHWHADTFDVPPGAIALYASEACQNQGFVLDERIVGLQFHFEMTPHAVANLVEHSASDLVEAPFVQGRKKLLHRDAPYRENEAALRTLLNGWLARD